VGHRYNTAMVTRQILTVEKPILRQRARKVTQFDASLHRLLDGTLVLLTYTGRKTGRQYTIPIGYFAWEEGELMSFSSARWWTNLRSSPPVTLLLKGHRVQAIPTVIDTLEEFIKRLGPRAARRLPIGLPRDREPTRDDLRNVPRGIALVQFQLV